MIQVGINILRERYRLPLVTNVRQTLEKSKTYDETAGKSSAAASLDKAILLKDSFQGRKE